jgi:hypothetical protein
MTRQERRKWIILAGLFLCLFLIVGPPGCDRIAAASIEAAAGYSA